MGLINIGNQKISYAYKEQGLASVYNKINYKLHNFGIYEGGYLEKLTNTSLNITPFICVVEDTSNHLSVRIQTQSKASVINVSTITPWIIGRFSWIDEHENYMDFLAVSKDNILDSDLIFGYVDYNGTTMTNDFDYTSKSWEINRELRLNDSTPFKVIADEPYSNKVIVQKGGPYFFNGRWVEIITDIESPEVEFPISSFGRKDVVAIDSLTNNIVIIKGFENSNNLPEIDTQYFPVAILNLPGSVTSLVRGHYIDYIHPNKFLTSKDTAIGLLNKLKTIDGEGSQIDLDFLGGETKEYFNKKAFVNMLNNYPSIRSNITGFQSGDVINSACFFNGKIYVATNRSSPSTNFNVYSSSNGYNFTSVYSTTSSIGVLKVVNNVLFVFGSAVALYSTNGTSFTVTTPAASRTFTDVFYLSDSGRYVFIGTASNVCYSYVSLTLSVWTEYIVLSETGANNITSGTQIGNKIILSSGRVQYANGKIAKSINGQDWTISTVSEFANAVVNLCYYKNLLIASVRTAPGSNFNVYKYLSYYSSNEGVSWSKGTNFSDYIVTVSTNNTYINRFININDKVLFYHGGNDMISYSLNGITWMQPFWLKCNIYRFSSTFDNVQQYFSLIGVKENSLLDNTKHSPFLYFLSTDYLSSSNYAKTTQIINLGDYCNGIS